MTDDRYLLTKLERLREQMSENGKGPAADPSLTTELEEVSLAITAFPAVFSECRCFMLDVIGQAESNGRIAPANDLRDRIQEVGGPLASAVLEFLLATRIPLPDCGYGEEEWHIGAYCTASEAWALNRRLCNRFKKALNGGLLMLRLRPWAITPLRDLV